MAPIITNQYWIAADTNPTTQVFSSAVSPGAFISNTNATFKSWLNAADGRADQIGAGVVAAANNGAGLIRVQCGSTINMQTGMVVNYVGNNSGAAGAAAITKIDGTHFDIQGSTWSVDDTAGTIWSATWIATKADLFATLNIASTANLPTTTNWAAPTQTTQGANIVLTNPLKNVTILTNNAAGGATISAALPPMNMPNSIPIGVPFWIVNDQASNGNISIIYLDGVTGVPPWGTTISLPPGTSVQFILTDNSTSNGTVVAIGNSSEKGALGLLQGGTGADLHNNTRYGTVFLDTIGFAGFLNTTSPGTVGQELRQAAANAPAWTSPAPAGLTDASGAFPISAGLWFYFLAALSAPRTRHLPTANTFPPGTRFSIVDPTGAVSATNTFSVDLVTATDKLNGVVNGSVVAINHAFGWAAFVTDGVSAWSSVDATDASNLLTGTVPAARLSTATTQAAGDNSTLIATDAFVTTAINNAIAGVNTAWTAYTPTITAGAGAFTTASAAGRYKTIGKTTFIDLSFLITTVGTASGAILLSLPNTGGSGAGGFGYTLNGQLANNNNMLIGVINSGATVVQILKYDGTSVIGANNQGPMSGVYENA